MSSVDPLSEEGIRAALGGGHQAWLEHLDVFGSIDSTNDWLSAQRPPAPGRLSAAVADYQTRGRGRRGRRWHIPPGCGICLSVARRLGVAVESLSAVTLACGVGAAMALERFGTGRILLKWPNDLVLRDGKLGGILTETVADGGSGSRVVAGIGINVSLPADFAPPSPIGWGRGPAALAEVLERPPPRDALAAALIEGLQQALDDYETGGVVAGIHHWRDRDWLMGREITVEDAGSQVRGTAAGIDEDGMLLVDTAAGRRRIVAGDILGCRRRATEQEGE